MIEQGRIACTIERYSVVDNELHRELIHATTGYHLKGEWLKLHNCAASAQIDDLLAGAREGRGWLAQFGMPPVYLDGEWGGRNYPEIRITAEDLLKLEEILNV
jgi:hypothetical protein